MQAAHLCQACSVPGAGLGLSKTDWRAHSAALADAPVHETDAPKDPSPGRESCPHTGPGLNRLSDSGSQPGQGPLTPEPVLWVLGLSVCVNAGAKTG